MIKAALPPPFRGLFEEHSNGERLYHISTPAGIAELTVINKNETRKIDIYYLYNDYQGSLIAAQRRAARHLNS